MGTGFLSALSGGLMTDKPEYFGMQKIRVCFTDMIRVPLPGYVTLAGVLLEGKDERECSSLSGSSDLVGQRQAHGQRHYKVESGYKDSPDRGHLGWAMKAGGCGLEATIKVAPLLWVPGL